MKSEEYIRLRKMFIFGIVVSLITVFGGEIPVVLRKLAMPAAGGVPCVGSTFFIPQHRKKGYIWQKHF